MLPKRCLLQAHLLDLLLGLACGAWPTELARAAEYLLGAPGGPDAFWAAAEAFAGRRSLFRKASSGDAAAAGRLVRAAWEAFARHAQMEHQPAAHQNGGGSRAGAMHRDARRRREEGAAAPALLFMSSLTLLAYEAG